VALLARDVERAELGWYDRVIVFNALAFRAGAYSPKLWLAAAFTAALPGIMVQPILIPVLLVALERSKVL